MVDEIDMLRHVFDADPVAERPEVVDLIRARVLAEASTVPPGPGHQASTGPGRRRLSRRRRAIAGAAAALCTIAALVAAATLLPTGGTLPGPSPAAAAVLSRAADAATTTSPTLPGPGQYVYTATTEDLLLNGEGFGANSPPYWYHETQTTQRWTGDDGSGRTVLTYTPVTFVTPADQAAWVATGQPLPTSVPSDQSYGPSAQRAADNLDPTGLPTDPSTLRAALAQRYGTGTDPALVISAVVSLLDEPGITPKLRSALFDALAATPGINSYGTTTDALGRSGDAVGAVVEGIRVLMIFDPVTTALLGEQKTVVDAAQLVVPPHLSASQVGAIRSETAGTVLDTETFATPGIVSSTTAVP